KCVDPLLHQARESHIYFTTGAGREDVDFPPDGRTRLLRLCDLGFGILTVRIDEYRKARRLWQQFAQDSKPLCCNLHVHVGDAGDVAARPIEAGDEAHLDRVAGGVENNWNRRRRCPCRERRRAAMAATWRRTRSAANSESREVSFCAERNSIA